MFDQMKPIEERERRLTEIMKKDMAEFRKKTKQANEQFIEFLRQPIGDK